MIRHRLYYLVSNKIRKRSGGADAVRETSRFHNEECQAHSHDLDRRPSYLSAFPDQIQFCPAV